MYSPAGSRHVIIRKTDRDGAFITADDFSATYAMIKDNNCNVVATWATNCRGATAIETNIGASVSGSRYAVVSTGDGSSAGSFLCFFTLDQVGNVVNTAYYDFPANTSSYTKPYIVEDLTTTGDYYICGSYTVPNGLSTIQVMYVLKINISGAITWANTYSSGNVIQPKGIIQSPFNQNELIVIGRTIPDPNQPPFLNRADDGFYLNLDDSN